MDEQIDKTYWIAVAHLPKWSVERTNRFIIEIIHNNKISWADFFSLSQNEWKGLFDLTGKEINDLVNVKSDLPRIAFITEQLLNEGFEIIPIINSNEYSRVLSENLKIKSAPPVLYIKGRKSLLQEDAVAIVGSRKASEKALAFTDQIARKCVRESKVVVSGFAKGIDQQALESSLKANGKSIIVLPQGILTFQSGFKRFYEQIVNGDVLVLSTFFPKAGWDVGLAMARNAYIYGLAKEIFVAESDSKGGTWQGALDGLKRGRSIFVRYPEAKEKNANLDLIELGARPVNMDGEIMDLGLKTIEPSLIVTLEVNDRENLENEGTIDVEKEILDFLKSGIYSSKEIRVLLKLEWENKSITKFLKKNPNVKIIPGSPTKYTRAEAVTLKLF